MKLSYKILKNRHREIRENQSNSIKLKIHRSLSWLRAAEEQEQSDTKFLLLWIAFNSIYSKEFNQYASTSEKAIYKKFLSQLVSLDKENLIYNIVWKNYSGKFRVFIENKFVFRSFWDFIDNKISEDEWEKRFERDKKNAATALMKKDSARFLTILFDRLYILRNQLMHGGATFESGINRDQIRDGSQILEQIVPVIIQLVMENSEDDWGEPSYRPVE